MMNYHFRREYDRVIFNHRSQNRLIRWIYYVFIYCRNKNRFNFNGFCARFHCDIVQSLNEMGFIFRVVMELKCGCDAILSSSNVMRSAKGRRQFSVLEFKQTMYAMHRYSDLHSI